MCKVRRILSLREEKMFNTKIVALGIVLLACVVTSTLSFADSGIPNLVGTWTVKTEGGVLLKGSASGPKTHHSGEYSTLTAEMVVTKQQGRVVYGTFTSPKATERFIAVIGMDNKTLYYADEDGFTDCKIVNKDRMDVVYRHVTALDTVIGVGTFTRKK
jgi:hypothetical protein